MRPLLLGLLLAVVALLGGRGERAVSGGNAARCSTLTGDTARACYQREVAVSLGAAPAPAPARGVEFATATTLVCDLHARRGVWQ